MSLCGKLNSTHVPHVALTQMTRDLIVSGRIHTFASFIKEVNPRLAKRPLVFNGRLANHGLTSLEKEANERHAMTRGLFRYKTASNPYTTFHYEYMQS